MINPKRKVDFLLQIFYEYASCVKGGEKYRTECIGCEGDDAHRILIGKSEEERRGEERREEKRGEDVGARIRWKYSSK